MSVSIEIRLGALRRNAALLRAMVAPGSHAAFVVKGNAYGHGMLECALAIEPEAFMLCVFSAREALELREGGITKPVLVLGPVESRDLRETIEQRIDIALWDTKAFLRDAVVAARAGHTRARVHVKVNTGLNRLGLEPEELPDAAEEYARTSDLEIAGIFSHLAAAEEIDSPYTTFQLDRFVAACDAAQPVLGAHGARPLRHIAASAAAMLWPQTRLDMGRFGIALYGLWPSSQTERAVNGGRLPLEAVLSYRSKLAVVRHIAAGAAVGYGTTFHAPRDMRVGVVPAGYADGVPRALSNAGMVAVNGKRVPIIGRVAMNMFYVDLTEVPDAKPDSAVTLIGSDGEASVTADEWAAWTGTINYEIVARLPAEVPRTYSEDG